MKRPASISRKAATREKLLTATRSLMVAGTFRPTAVQIVHADGFSDRSIRQHFASLEDLYVAAVDDDTAAAILGMLLALRTERALALAVVLGRVP